MLCRGVASSTRPSRLTGVTQAAALMRVMMDVARSLTSGESQGGRSSDPDGRRSQSGACGGSSGSSGRGSPKLTYTLPKRLRSSGIVRSSVRTDSFSFGRPESSPM